MASPVPVEAVLSSLIINIHPLKQTVLFTTAYTKLCLNPKQAVYLLIPIIGHSHKLPWTSHWFYSKFFKLYHCILLQ